MMGIASARGYGTWRCRIAQMRLMRSMKSTECKTFLQFPLLLVQDEVPLLVPDILVCSVGTEILFGGEQRT